MNSRRQNVFSVRGNIHRIENRRLSNFSEFAVNADNRQLRSRVIIKQKLVVRTFQQILISRPRAFSAGRFLNTRRSRRDVLIIRCGSAFCRNQIDQQRLAVRHPRVTAESRVDANVFQRPRFARRRFDDPEFDTVRRDVSGGDKSAVRAPLRGNNFRLFRQINRRFRAALDVFQSQFDGVRLTMRPVRIRVNSQTGKPQHRL